MAALFLKTNFSYFWDFFSFLSLPSVDVALVKAFAEYVTRGTRQRIPLSSGLCRVGTRQSLSRVQDGPLSYSIKSQNPVVKVILLEDINFYLK